ncbi:MAG: polysaccharide biosynthesis protein [Chitinophagaceae bacterium]
MIKRLYSNPRYTKLFKWGQLVSITGAAQIIIQAVTLVNGILIIRLLPPHEYALYTLANMMLGTMLLLADGGITDGVMSQGGKVWQDPQKLGSVVATGMDIRKKFAIVSLAIVTPILVYLLRHHGASWLVTGLIVLALIPAFVAALSGTLLEVAPKLRQDIPPLQKIQVAFNTARTPLLAGFLFLFPWAYIAIFISSLPQLWANTRLKKISKNYADNTQPIDIEVRKKILAVVKRTLPGAIYYGFYGQISTWLVSIFGSTDSLAQVGALSRLAMVLTVLTVMSGILIVPRFARLPENKNILLKRFFQIQVLLLLVSAAVIGFVYLFSGYILSILGHNYTSFTTEIVVICFSSCLSMMMGVTYNISVSRAWVMPPWILISVNILTQLILIWSMDLSKTINVLWFSVINNTVAFLMISFYFLYRASKCPGNDARLKTNEQHE